MSRPVEYLAVAVIVGTLAALFFLRSPTAPRVEEAKEAVRVVDSVYFDREVIRDRWRTAYVAVRDSALAGPDSAAVAPVAEAADSALAACDSLVKAGERRVASRDSLIAALETPSHRLTPFAEALYDPFRRTFIARAGVQYPLNDRVTLIGGAQMDEEARAVVGLRVTF